jgi:ribosome biogenesis protein BMS1
LWIPVAPVEFYLPVTSLLAAPEVHKSRESSHGDDEPGGDDGGDGDELGEAVSGRGPPTARRIQADGGHDDGEQDGDDGEGGGDDEDNQGEGGEGGWTGMRTVAELRRAQGAGVPLLKDSLYKPVERTKRVFNPIPVPRVVEAALPYASKTKNVPAKSTKGYLVKRAAVLEPSERKRVAFLNTLGTIRNDKKATRVASDARRSVEKAAKKRKLDETFELHTKAAKKSKHRKAGLELKAKSKARH